MRLTPELVALVTHGGRAIEDLVPPPGTTLASEAEQTATIAEVLAQGPSDDVWIFAYGSLIWNAAMRFRREAHRRRARLAPLLLPRMGSLVPRSS